LLILPNKINTSTFLYVFLQTQIITVMKRKIVALTSLVIMVFLLVGHGSVTACEFRFEIEQGKKDKYQVGDKIVVVVTLSHTHRVCHESLSDVRFTSDGLKVIGVMDWVEVSPSLFTRKLQIEILGSKDGKATFTAARGCERDGGRGTLTLETVIVK